MRNVRSSNVNRTGNNSSASRYNVSSRFSSSENNRGSNNVRNKCNVNSRFSSNAYSKRSVHNRRNNNVNNSTNGRRNRDRKRRAPSLHNASSVHRRAANSKEYRKVSRVVKVDAIKG